MSPDLLAWLYRTIMEMEDETLRAQLLVEADEQQVWLAGLNEAGQTAWIALKSYQASLDEASYVHLHYSLFPPGGPGPGPQLENIQVARTISWPCNITTTVEEMNRVYDQLLKLGYVLFEMSFITSAPAEPSGPVITIGLS